MTVTAWTICLDHRTSFCANIETQGSEDAVKPFIE